MLSLKSVKKHLNVEHNEDDEYIQSLIDISVVVVGNMVNCPLESLSKGGSLPKPLQHAIRMIVGKLYAYREGDTLSKTEEVAFTLSNLIMPYRFEK